MKHTMKKTLALRACRDMHAALQVIKDKTFSTMFTHAAARNRARLKNKIKALQEAGKPVDGYNDRHEELAKGLARKDAAGEPMAHPNGGWIVIDLFNFNRHLDELKAELGQDKREAEVEVLLDAEEEVKISMVEHKFLPANLSLGVIHGLLPMIAAPPAEITTLKLTKESMRDMWAAMQDIMTLDYPAPFTHTIARNRVILLPHMEEFEKASKAVEGYDARRIALAQELSRKDQQGQPLLHPDGKDYLVTDAAAFSRRLDVIKQETGQVARDAEVAKLLEEEIEVGLYTLDEDGLPSTMSTAVLEGFLPIVVDPDEEGESEAGEPAPVTAIH
jgi:hypothetical protein